MRDRLIDFICTDVNSLWIEVISQLNGCCFGEFDSFHDLYHLDVQTFEDALYNSYLGLIP